MDVLPTDTNSMTWVSSRNAPNLLIGNMIQLPLIFWAWTKRCGPKIVQTQIQLLVKSSMAIYWIKYTVCRCMSMYWILYAPSTVGVLWLNLTWRAHMFFTWPTCLLLFSLLLVAPIVRSRPIPTTEITSIEDFVKAPLVSHGFAGVVERGIWWDTFTMGFVTLYNYAM